MDYIDYSEAKFQFVGTRKHFFKDKQYFVTIFEDSFVMGNTLDTQQPKYKILLDLDVKINWEIKKTKSGTKLQSFVFQHQNRTKTVHSTHENLMRFKDLLGVKATFEGIGDLYCPILQIGKGSSAKVYSAESVLDQKIYAIKAIEKSFLQQSENGSGLVRYQSKQVAYKMEVQVLKTLSHYIENFLTLKEIYEGDSTYYLVTDYLEGSSLSEEIDRAKMLPDKRLPMKFIRIIMFKLLKNLAVLQQHKIIHRDLKPDNLMFARKNDYQSLVLVDFGLATSESLERYELNQFRYLFPKCGTPGYVAPEVLSSKPENKYTAKIDIFSSGCIFYKLLVGRNLFTGKSFDEVLRSNKKCIMDLELPIDQQYITETSLHLLSQLLNKNANQRPSAKQALSHPFFDQLIEQSTQVQITVNIKQNSNTFCDEQFSKYNNFEDEEINQEKNKEEPIAIQLPYIKRASLLGTPTVLLKQYRGSQFYQKEPLSVLKCFKVADLISPRVESESSVESES